MSQFERLEAEMNAVMVGAKADEADRLRAQLDEVKRVLDDPRGAAEERLRWLREFLA